MQLRDPMLLGASARADIGIILEGMKARMSELCAFARQKCGQGGEGVAVVTNIPTVPRLIALSEEIMRRRRRGMASEGSGGVGEEVSFPQGYSHIRPIGEIPTRPPTDWLLREVQSLRERLQPGGSHSHGDEQDVSLGNEQSEWGRTEEDFLTDEEDN